MRFGHYENTFIVHPTENRDEQKHPFPSVHPIILNKGSHSSLFEEKLITPSKRRGSQHRCIGTDRKLSKS